MKKYFLKPGTFIDSKSLSIDNPPGLNLENYIVSVINNPTCCPKNLGGGGIEGTMLAMATATGTPEENGISAFNAYKSVRDNSYFLRKQQPAGFDTEGDIANIYFQPGVGELDGILRVDFHNLNNFMGAYFAEGKVYALPIGPNKDQIVYGQYMPDATDNYYWFKYVPMPGELSGRITGYPFETLAGNTPNLYNFQVQYTSPTPTTSVPIYEVELVRPMVLLPAGEYKWPAMSAVGEYTGIDSPVSFVGLDKHSTILSDSSNMVISYGYAFSSGYDVLPNTRHYSHTTPVAQSIIFSNLTYSTSQFEPASMQGFGEISAEAYNSIIFDNCNIKGSIGNTESGQSFSFTGFFNCDIYPSVINAAMNFQYFFYKFEGCNFVGEQGVLGQWGDIIYMAGPMTAMGNTNQNSSWIFDSNAGGRNVWLGNSPANYVEAAKTNFFLVLEGRSDLKSGMPNIWNYTTTQSVNNGGTQTSLVNYSALGNTPWPA